MASKKALTGKHNYAEFKEETIANRVKKMVDYREGVDVENAHVKFSYGNRKTGNLVPSVSLIPIADCCSNCACCAKGCYAVRNICCYDATRKMLANNSAILKLDREKYFREVEAHAQFHRFFRWHVGGDIKDYDYFGQVVGIATRVPGCQFLIFTKMYDIVNEWIENVGELPSNLHVIFSDWRGAKMRNPHCLPVSSPVWKDGTCGDSADLKSGTWCPGECSLCATTNGGCWEAKKGDTILFEAH